MEEEIGKWNSEAEKETKLENCPEIVTITRYGGAKAGDDDIEAVFIDFF